MSATQLLPQQEQEVIFILTNCVKWWNSTETVEITMKNNVADDFTMFLFLLFVIDLKWVQQEKVMSRSEHQPWFNISLTVCQFAASLIW